MADTKVYFVSAGPGDPELLTVKALKILKKSDAVFYAGSLVNPEMLKVVKKGALLVDMKSLNYDEIKERLENLLKRPPERSAGSSASQPGGLGWSTSSPTVGAAVSPVPQNSALSASRRARSSLSCSAVVRSVAGVCGGGGGGRPGTRPAG